MAAHAPMLHTFNTMTIGASSTVVAGIFYAAWAAHLLEACYALTLLSRNGWLRASTAVPWFALTCARARARASDALALDI